MNMRKLQGAIEEWYLETFGIKPSRVVQLLNLDNHDLWAVNDGKRTRVVSVKGNKVGVLYTLDTSQLRTTFDVLNGKASSDSTKLKVKLITSRTTDLSGIKWDDNENYLPFNKRLFTSPKDVLEEVLGY